MLNVYKCHKSSQNILKILPKLRTAIYTIQFSIDISVITLSRNLFKIHKSLFPEKKNPGQFTVTTCF